MAAPKDVSFQTRLYMHAGLLAFWSLAFLFSYVVLYAYEEHYHEEAGPYWSFSSMTPFQRAAFALHYALALPLVFPAFTLGLSSELWPLFLYAVNPVAIGIFISRFFPRHTAKAGTMAWGGCAVLLLIASTLMLLKPGWAR